jgi:hypothetical protein
MVITTNKKLVTKLIDLFIGLGFWYGSRQVIDNELTGASVMVVFFALILGMYLFPVFYFPLLRLNLKMAINWI